MCAICQHVFNVDFNYAKIPYAEDSNLMYNSGATWKSHMGDLITKLAAFQSHWGDRTVIDIGCGDGLFISKLKSMQPNANYLGFEPGIDATKITGFQVIRDYFIPERDIKRYRPKLLICRHVIEHLEDPRQFVSEIAYWCGNYGVDTLFLVEVPCFDKSLSLGRISDFLYEHVSNFTHKSFCKLFELSGYSELFVSKYYGDEILAGIFMTDKEEAGNNMRTAQKFSALVLESVLAVTRQLADFQVQQEKLVFWGGTGKGAAFLNTYGIDAKAFPLVVDSDPRKIGRCVPGTGQVIQDPEILRHSSESIIVIATPWRADDIKADIDRRGLTYSRLLVLRGGELRDFT
jgi:hypothetical protein